MGNTKPPTEICDPAIPGDCIPTYDPHPIASARNETARGGPLGGPIGVNATRELSVSFGTFGAQTPENKDIIRQTYETHQHSIDTGIQKEWIEYEYSSKQIALAHGTYVKARANGIDAIDKKWQKQIDVVDKGIADLQEKQGFHPLDTLASAIGGAIGGGWIGAAVGVATNVIGTIAKDASIDSALAKLNQARQKMYELRNQEMATLWPDLVPFGVTRLHKQQVRELGHPAETVVRQVDVGSDALPLWALRETVLQLIRERRI